ncbi:MAG: hypothetical protein IIA72_14475 [Proteobacteria bacterium]|nr:hypothetical protein [Pseudomonadota bacterium]
MSKIKELLLARRREVKGEITPLKAELKEIDTALAAIGGNPVVAAKGNVRAGSIADQTLDILNDHPGGLPTRTMVREMRHRFGREIEKRNMSWHLSRLKREDKLILDGELWRIPSAQNETPDSISGASSTTGDGNGNPPSNESGEPTRSLTELPGASPADSGP